MSRPSEGSVAEFQIRKDAKINIKHSCEHLAEKSGHVTNLFHPGDLIGDNDNCIYMLAHLIHKHGLILKPTLERS